MKQNGKPDKDSETKSIEGTKKSNKNLICFNGSPTNIISTEPSSNAEYNNKNKTNIGKESLVKNQSENKNKTAAAPRQIQKPCLEPVSIK